MVRERRSGRLAHAVLARRSEIGRSSRRAFINLWSSCDQSLPMVPQWEPIRFRAESTKWGTGRPARWRWTPNECNAILFLATRLFSQPAMNHFLVSVLGFLNGALAVAIILVGAGTGASLWTSANPANQDLGGAVIGGFVGLIVAAVVCGLLAIAISIEKSLKNVAERMPQPGHVAAVRIVPSGPGASPSRTPLNSEFYP